MPTPKRLPKFHSGSDVYDRVNLAFAALRKKGLIARQGFACCGNCAAGKLATLLRRKPHKPGAVYYHAQQAEGFARGQDLYLSFGANPATSTPNTEDALSIQVGHTVTERLRAFGLRYEWNESSGDCIKVLVKNEIY